MHCPCCGNELPDDARFCDLCGSPVATDETPANGGTDREKSTENESIGGQCSLREQETKQNAQKRLSKKALVTIGVGVVAVLVIVIAVALLATGFLDESKDIPEEVVFSALDAESIAADAKANNSLIKEDAYRVDSETLDAVHETDGGLIQAHVTVVLKNSYYAITNEYSLEFLRDGETWECVSGEMVGNDISPISGIDDQTVVDNVLKCMEIIDSNQSMKVDGKTVKLKDLYKANLTIALLSNDTNENGGNATVLITSSNGLAQYKGALTIPFTWDNSEKEWKIGSCTVDENAYTADYSGMIGTWSGSFKKTVNGIIGGTDHSDCYGGRQTLPEMVVKSVSADGKTFIADISFVIHQHSEPGNPQETADGDRLFTAENVLVTINEIKSMHQVYEEKGVDGTTDVVVKLKAEESSSTMTLCTKSSYTGPAGGWAWKETDYYTFNFSQKNE